MQEVNIFKVIKRKIVSYQKLIAKYTAPETIFIYQMGKVGSTTLEYSLPNAVHLHAFYNKNHTCPARLHGLAKFGFTYFFRRAEQEFTHFLLRRAFKKRKNTKIITLVREPLARNMSMFFHDLDAYIYAAHTNCLNTRQRALPTRHQSRSLLTDIFNQEFNHHYPLTWFDKEFMVMTGIDIYQHSFDIEQGIGYAQHQGTEVICLRIDKLQEHSASLSRFVGQPIELMTQNKAEDKWYAELYQAFKSDYVLSKPLKTELYNSKYYQKFFL